MYDEYQRDRTQNESKALGTAAISSTHYRGGHLANMDFRVDPEDLRRAMRRWATGVTVVASAHQGVRHGMTVSSFTSVSLLPPLVLVSIEQGARTHDLIVASGAYAVTILGAKQQSISDLFAGRLGEGEDRFLGLETYSLKTGSPLLTSGLAGLDCRVVEALPAGNHTIFVGEVVAAYTGSDTGDPLLYYDRDYREICDE
jgi:flavin reductase (DIM6/NTAB) family NADH-FMN oxidoreductase RutF